MISCASPSSIKPHDDLYLCTVRGKRNNFDAVALSADARDGIVEWVDSFNGGLATDDPRRVGLHNSVWQALSRVGRYLEIGYNGYDPLAGLSHQGIRDVVARRTSILGQEYICGVHDMRRTAAAIADQHGMKLTDISAMLRHANVATTARYIGKKRNYAEQNLLRYASMAA
jgi:integrase